MGGGGGGVRGGKEESEREFREFCMNFWVTISTFYLLPKDL